MRREMDGEVRWTPGDSKIRLDISIVVGNFVLWERYIVWTVPLNLTDEIP